jgi:2,3-bisphosphoglycerate-independent phosphoglycerate mutase
VIAAVRSGRFRFLRANFAAGDMVGHTGSLEAAILAIQAVDQAIARILPAVLAARGVLVVTADHGNSDDMAERDKAGRPQRDPAGRVRSRTSHTLNPVPFLVLEGADRRLALATDLPGAGIAHVAATLLTLLGLAPPPEFDASLVVPA